MEYFGITTVEAMSAGCVSVVINKGGQPEIVQDMISGFLFEDIDELNRNTHTLMTNNTLWRKMSDVCIERRQKFSSEVYKRRVKEVF